MSRVGNRFLVGHARRGKTWTDEERPKRLESGRVAQSRVETRDRIAATLRRHYEEHPEAREHQAIQTARRMSEQEHKDSFLEKILRRLLDYLGIEYVTQYQMWRYCVDFADVSNKIAYEADGPYHDKDPTYDRNRDAWLESQGWTVIRFQWWKLGYLSQILDRADLFT